MPRFVILRHETPAGFSRPAHWDFMLESGAVLLTWALAKEPAATVVIASEKLADHRLAYLDYEGEVSGDRGCVTRWDWGTCEVVEESAELLAVRLDGRRIRGDVRLARQQDGTWEWSWKTGYFAGS